MGMVTEVLPISDLRHRQNEILASLQKGPVILTQRGRGAAVLLSLDEWNMLLERLSRSDFQGRATAGAAISWTQPYRCSRARMMNLANRDNRNRRTSSQRPPRRGT